MTPVQAHTIPILLMFDEGATPGAGCYDLMAAAQTGSGKTLAYLLPVLHNVMCNYPSDAMNALVCYLLTLTDSKPLAFRHFFRKKSRVLIIIECVDLTSQHYIKHPHSMFRFLTLGGL